MSIFDNFFLTPKERLAKRFVATVAECLNYVYYIQDKYRITTNRCNMVSYGSDILTFVNSQAALEMDKHWNYGPSYRKNYKAPYTRTEFDNLISFLEEYTIFEIFSDCYDSHMASTIEHKYDVWVDGLTDIYEDWFDAVKAERAAAKMANQ